MSDLMQIIQSRRSTRAFESMLPPKEQVMQLVEAAGWAPSGMGKYLWHFTVVYSAEKSLRLARAVAEADNRGPDYNFYGAPVNIIISYKKEEHHAFVDGAVKGWKVATQNMLPNVVLAFAFIKLLQTSGLLDAVGHVCSPVMGLFGLPGEAVTVLISTWFSAGGGVAAAAVGVGAGLGVAGAVEAADPGCKNHDLPHGHGVLETEGAVVFAQGQAVLIQGGHIVIENRVLCQVGKLPGIGLAADEVAGAVLCRQDRDTQQQAECQSQGQDAGFHGALLSVGRRAAQAGMFRSAMTRSST